MAIDNLSEEWRQIEGWPYEVSNLGRVRRHIADTRCYRSAPGRLRKLTLNHKVGYYYVELKDRPRSQIFRVNRLVALTFIGPAPTPKHEVAHNDGDRLNNSSTNLRWATRIENQNDRIAHNRTNRGTRCAAHKLSDFQVLAIRDLYRSGAKNGELARRYGVNTTTVHHIIQGTTWSWLKPEDLPVPSPHGQRASPRRQQGTQPIP